MEQATKKIQEYLSKETKGNSKLIFTELGDPSPCEIFTCVSFHYLQIVGLTPLTLSSGLYQIKTLGTEN
jgi:hypothetical protein